MVFVVQKNKMWERIMDIPKPVWAGLEYNHPMGMRKIEKLKIVSTDNDGVFYRKFKPVPPSKVHGNVKGKESDLLWMNKKEFLSHYKSLNNAHHKESPSAEKFELVKEFETIMETEYRKVNNETI